MDRLLHMCYHKAISSFQVLIKISNFSKSFGSLEVIRDLSFEVRKGEIFAYLGANGSGKTTTLRCLLGIYPADSGELLINGEPYSSGMSSILGYLPEERGLYVNSRVLETLIHFGRLKGLQLTEAKKWSEAYLEKVNLVSKRDSEIKKLSSGQQQKIQLGVTLINEPELLIMDEPWKGLDPVNRDLLGEMLQELNDKGTTIIFSTHQMDDAEKVADRVLMLKDGNAAVYGELNEVKSRFGDNILKITFNGSIPDNPEMYTAKKTKNYAELTPRDHISTDKILKFLVGRDVSIKKFDIAAPSLHEVFVKISKDEQ